MVSITLPKEIETIAKKYANGNLSEFIRALILEHHQNKTNEKQIKKTILFGQTIVYIITGTAFILLTISLLFPLLVMAALLFLLIGGVIIFSYGVGLMYMHKNKQNEVILYES